MSTQPFCLHLRISIFIASEHCPLLARECLLLELCEMSLLSKRKGVWDRDDDIVRV